ncbi:MAG: U32 family peptidase [Deltaproteobacteria bacterium]|jgi:putative protease|nr:U32 family peptidase [Deltaproteobacteria bacterium]
MEESANNKEANNKAAQKGTRGPLPELLAPVGTPSAFAAAAVGGADAVYVGLKRYSARKFADNFTLGELSGLINEAHKCGIKVYIALNSLVRQGDLTELYKTLLGAAELGPDAFIVQDLGMAYLCRKLLRGIELHASTLSAVHTVDGLMAMKRMGFKRVILPRELSFQEIEYLSSSGKIDTEIFVHGAMCFCQSGLCTFSSYMGARSAREGACTQPCRRVYLLGEKKGTFFSPKDLETLANIKDLRKLPLAAFKIEGRMKGADYVEKVTRAYRLLMDTEDKDFSAALDYARELVGDLPTRATGSGFMEGLRPQDPKYLFSKDAVSGQYLGRLKKGKNGYYSVILKGSLKLMDRLRVVTDTGESGVPFKLKKLLLNGKEEDFAPKGAQPLLFLPEKKGFVGSGLLYKVGSSDAEKRFAKESLTQAVLQGAGVFKPKRYKHSKKLEGLLKEKESPPYLISPAQRAKMLWLRLSSGKDLHLLAKLGPARFLLPLTEENISFSEEYPSELCKKVVWTLPPLTYHPLDDRLKELALLAISKSILETPMFMAANIGQVRQLMDLPRRLLICTDTNVPVLNHLAALQLFKEGVFCATISEECDKETYRKLNRADMKGMKLLFYLYGRPALFTSRMHPPEIENKATFMSSRGELFTLESSMGIQTVHPQKGLFLSSVFEKPVGSDLIGYIVDVRSEKDPLASARAVFEAVKKGKPFIGSPGDMKTQLQHLKINAPK